MKKISVIIPCYNVENYIDSCINSLVCQTMGMENMELIFVDDASTDGTMGKLVEWEAKYPESILVIHCDENRKQGAARNIGLSYASADYIGFVDADDWIEPEMYESLYLKIKELDCDIVGCHFQREERDGYVYHEITMPEGEADILVTREENGWPEGVQKLCGPVVCKLIRKDIILENEIFFPENLAYEDNYWDALLKYYYNSYYVIPKAFYHYIVNPDSTILKKDDPVHKDRLQIEIMKLQEFEKRGFLDRYREEIEADFVRLYYINSLHVFFLRYTIQDYALLNEMKYQVQSKFPNYDRNPRIRYGGLQNLLLKTLQVDLKDEDWEHLAASYRRAYGVMEE